MPSISLTPRATRPRWAILTTVVLLFTTLAGLLFACDPNGAQPGPEPSIRLPASAVSSVLPTSGRPPTSAHPGARQAGGPGDRQPAAVPAGTAGPAVAGAHDDEWQQYRHDTQRSGRAGAALPLGADGRLHLQWAYSLGERVEVEVEPIVAAGKVFVGAMNGVMTALNLSDGGVAWRFSAGPIPHTAAYDAGRLFFGSLDGFVYALDAASGSLLWKVQTGGPVYAAPAIANGVVYIGSTAGRFFALDAASGAEHWHYPAGPARLATAFTGAAALAPDGSRVYVTGIVPDLVSGCGSEFGTEDFGTVAYRAA